MAKRTDVCMYCKVRFKLPSFELEAEEKGKCFSCRTYEELIDGLSRVLDSSCGPTGQKSKEYWSGQLNSLINEIN